MNRYLTLLVRTQKEIPSCKVVRKSDSKFMRFLNFFVGMFNKNFMNSYTTTIFRTIYVPDDFPLRDADQQYSTLRHEMQHLRQFRSWPFKSLAKPGLWWINALIMAFCYTLVLPVWWTFRAHFEKAGYTQTLLVEYELGKLQDTERWVNWLVETFAGPSYLYMDDRKTAEKWARDTIIGIVSGKIRNDQDRID